MKITANYSSPIKRPVWASKEKRQVTPSQEDTTRSVFGNNPSFKQVLLSGLKMKEIEALYEDGPAIARVIKSVAPVFNEKFGDLFIMLVNVSPDFFRTISATVKGNPNKREILKNYILENNKNIKIPRFVIYDTKNGGEKYWHFPFVNLYEAVHIKSFSDVKEMGAMQMFLKFIRETNRDKLIKSIYDAEPCKIVTQ